MPIALSAPSAACRPFPNQLTRILHFICAICGRISCSSAACRPSPNQLTRILHFICVICGCISMPSAAACPAHQRLAAHRSLMNRPRGYPAIYLRHLRPYFLLISGLPPIYPS
jgi:hypothetical protein